MSFTQIPEILIGLTILKTDRIRLTSVPKNIAPRLMWTVANWHNQPSGTFKGPLGTDQRCSVRVPRYRHPKCIVKPAAGESHLLSKESFEAVYLACSSPCVITFCCIFTLWGCEANVCPVQHFLPCEAKISLCVGNLSYMLSQQKLISQWQHIL